MRTAPRFRNLALLAGGGLLALAVVMHLSAQPASQEKPTGKDPVKPAVKLDLKFSGPYKYDNLTVFLVHGEDKLKGKNFLTLPEAMAKDKLVIYETKQVNKLEMENVSDKEEILLLSGDIITGGQQDRVIVFDMIVPPKSGKVVLTVNCVEKTASRWMTPWKEKDKKFHASLDVLNSKGLRLANSYYQDQGKVWMNVEKAQHELTKSLGANVISKKSESSLQLSLKAKEVNDATDKYLAKLEDIIKDKKDVIGYAFGINGKVYGVDVYGSRDVFLKVWPRLLRASAVEAVMEMPKDQKQIKATELTTVQEFLKDAESGKLSTQKVNESIERIQSEAKFGVHIQTIDQKQKLFIRGAYYAH